MDDGFSTFLFPLPFSFSFSFLSEFLKNILIRFGLDVIITDSSSEWDSIDGFFFGWKIFMINHHDLKQSRKIGVGCQKIP